MRSAKSKGIKDPEYLHFIHQINCIICEGGRIGVSVRFRAPAVEAHHAGERGLGQKADDRTAIPLCRDHHLEGKDAVHKLGKKFWAHHGIDKQHLIKRLNDTFEHLKRREK